MNLKKSFLYFSALILFTQCKSPFQFDQEIADELYKATYTTNHKPINSNIDLYLDYSTCVKDAVTNSMFFKSIRPKITGLSNLTLHAIKGDNIDSVSNDASVINSELNNIQDISYANIKGALDKINSNNSQAILITDAEYWTVPQGERINLPYMKTIFSEWLNKGYCVNIIIENYKESYKGNYYDKKRFYLIFTDDLLSNNVFDQICKASAFKDGDITLFKLSNNDFGVVGVPIVNEELTAEYSSSYTTKTVIDLQTTSQTATYFTSYGYDYFEIDNQWSDICEYVFKNNEPIIGGLTFVVNGLCPYSINNFTYDAKVYSKENIDSESYEIKDANKGFKLVKDNNKIAVLLQENLFTEDILSEYSENLIRIDIIVSDATPIDFDHNIFSWSSLSQPNQDNISFYESIKQTLDDPKVNPINQNNGIAYTIFLKTGVYKN